MSWSNFSAFPNTPNKLVKLLGLRKPNKKRKRFIDTKVYSTIAFANGKLFGGCLNDDCPFVCSPILTFSASSKKEKHFICAIAAYEAAVLAEDSDVTDEFRSMIETLRGNVCSECHMRTLPQTNNTRIQIELKILK